MSCSQHQYHIKFQISLEHSNSCNGLKELNEIPDSCSFSNLHNTCNDTRLMLFIENSNSYNCYRELNETFKLVLFLKSSISCNGHTFSQTFKFSCGSFPLSQEFRSCPIHSRLERACHLIIGICVW